MKRRAHIDVESRSKVDLTKTGVYVYSQDPSTQITIACWRVDDGPMRTWKLGGPIEILQELTELAADPEVVFVAFNASFERVMLSAPPAAALGISLPRDPARWECAAACAAGNGLPRSLEGAAAALALPVQKDTEGRRLMLLLCKPRKPRKGEPTDVTLWHETPEQIERLAAYCRQDVVTECAVDAKLPPMSAVEREAWIATEEANDHGIPIDPAMLPKMRGLIDAALKDLDRDINTATNGAVPRVSDAGALGRWLTAQGVQDHIGDDDKASVAKGILQGMVENPALDPAIRSVCMMRLDGGGAAIKKFDAMGMRLSGDSRVRGELVYSGAAMTRRWSSQGVQFQNLIRGGALGKRLLHAVRDLLDSAPTDYLSETYSIPALLLAAEMLRPIIEAPAGYWVARGDLSQIEARVIAWLARALARLATFRAADAGTGPDQYRVTAAKLLRKAIEAVTKDDRQLMGKVPELALGFQGGANAIQTGAYKAGVVIPAAERPKDAPWDWPAPEGTDLWIVQQWREANPEIVQLWKDCESAAIECLERRPGDTVPVGAHGNIKFRRSGAVMAALLPSGRPVPYWTPTLVHKMTPWGKRKLTFTYRAQDLKTKRWEEFTAYGGLLAQNATQATARDVMRDIVLDLRRGSDFTPFLLVHDEAVTLASKQAFPRADDAAAALLTVMTKEPAWAPGLPVNAEASAAERYVKV